MIIQRNKLFSKRPRDPLPNGGKLDMPEEWESKVIIYDLEYVGEYNNHKKVLGKNEKDFVDSLKQDLRDGYVMQDNPNRSKEENELINTHYLKDYSKKGKWVFSKSISSADRMVYTIGTPRLNEETDIVHVLIKIYSLLGHLIPGEKTKQYSQTEESGK